MRGRDGEVRLAPDRPHKGGDGGIVKNNRCAAILADQVVMRALADDFKDALVVDLGLADQPEVAQEIQRAIDRGPVDPGRLSAHPGVDGVGSQMGASPPAQGVVDDLSLRRGAQAMLMEQIAQVPAAGQWGSARLHGRDRIPQPISPGPYPALEQAKIGETH